jgi:hypothetical protein
MAAAHVFLIHPGSLYLPNGSIDGSLTENLNKTGVRLWIVTVSCGT